MNSLRVLVAGQPQSGSTLVFNLIRLAAIEAGHRVDSSHFVSWNARASIILRKIHEYEPNAAAGADVIITCCRDIRDCMVSHIVRQDRKGMGCGPWTPYYYGAWNLTSYKDWQGLSHHEVKYETFKADPLGGAQRLLDLVGLAVDTQKVVNQVEAAPQDATLVEDDDETSAQYRKTLLTKAHNTSGGASGKYKTYFSKAENDTLLQCFGLFLAETGYEAPQSGAEAFTFENHWETHAFSICLSRYGYHDFAVSQQLRAFDQFEKQYPVFGDFMQHWRNLTGHEPFASF